MGVKSPGVRLIGGVNVLVGSNVLVEDGIEVPVEVLEWLGEGVREVEGIGVCENVGFIGAVLAVVGVIVIVFDGAGVCVGPGKGLVPSSPLSVKVGVGSSVGSSVGMMLAVGVATSNGTNTHNSFIVPR
jgi:hypothetical protein